MRLLLISFVITLTACSSFNEYMKTRKSQYLTSQDLGPLKLPNSLKMNQPSYIIPKNVVKPLGLPNL